MKVLRVLANPKPVEKSASLQVEAAFMAALKAKHSGAEVVTVDVYKDEIPLLDAKTLPAFFGAVGLITGKKAVFCLASGGAYEGALAAYDTLTPMLKTQFGFIGVTDQTVLAAPGQGAGGEKAAASTAAAIAKAAEAAAKI